MRVRAVRSFVWHGPRDVDVGDVLDVPEREAFILVEAYGYCVYLDGPLARLDGGVPGMTVGHNDPVVEHRDPVAAPNAASKRRRS